MQVGYQRMQFAPYAKVRMYQGITADGKRKGREFYSLFTSTIGANVIFLFDLMLVILKGVFDNTLLCCSS